MIGTKCVLAVIPARGGSKALPGKNIAPVGGRPLLAWTAQAALTAGSIDRVVVSSDDEAILGVARACGCEPLRRPAALATDSAPTIDAVLHALDAYPGHDVVVVLQPTSPLRTASDIDAACERFTGSGATSCVSVCESEESPYWMYRIDKNDRLLPLLDTPFAAQRRQDLPCTYVLNGAIYVADAAWLRRGRRFVADDTVGVVMPRERSVDIDTQADLDLVRRLVDAIAPAREQHS